jgi:hypothetical protein
MENTMNPKKEDFCLHHFEFDSRIGELEDCKDDLYKKWNKLQTWLIALMGSSLVTLAFVLVGLVAK